jgi:GTP cyclohydrolase I
VDKSKIKKAISLLLEAIGEDSQREGLKKTPERVAKMYEEILSGMAQNPLLELSPHYNENYDEMIFFKDIPLYSICEHHLLPFFGRVHLAYIPGQNKIVGLSKLARVIEILSKRLQLQERLTTQIADTIMHAISPQGVLVVIEAEHMCMTMRGVKKPGSKIITSAIRGVFKKEATRLEAFSLIGR